MKEWAKKAIELLAPTMGGTVSTTVSTADEEFGRTPKQKAGSGSSRNLGYGNNDQETRSSMNVGTSSRRRQRSLIRDTSTGINI